MFRKVSAVNVAGRRALHVFQVTYIFIPSNQSPSLKYGPNHDQNHTRQRQGTYLNKDTAYQAPEIELTVRDGKVYSYHKPVG